MIRRLTPEPSMSCFQEEIHDDTAKARSMAWLALVFWEVWGLLTT